jgi:ribonuclease BN (tRNA processing enzyme)
MNRVNVQFLGSGDAFGSGGRFQTCIYVDGSQTKFLIDCGASSLIAMKRFDVDPSNIDIILVTHLHGDHFGGIPFIIRETQITSLRTRALLIVGPTGLEKRIHDAMEILFPGSSYAHLGFPLKFIELSDDQPNLVGSLLVTSYKAIHTKGTEPHSLRIEHDGRIIAYSGDTEWNENLIEAARDADLFICESFFYDEDVKNHLSYRQLTRYRSQLTCKRLILTHMSNDMLSRIQDVEVECAADGTHLEL